MSRPEPGTLASFYEPEWAGGWAVARWTWVAVAFGKTSRMAGGMGDVFGAPDMVFTRGPWRLSAHVTLTEPTAWACWALAMVGIALVAFRRSGALHLGLLLWIAGSQTLLFWEALNVKRHDVLFAWITLALLLSPAGEDRLDRKWRSPLARRLLLLVYCAAYGSTGLLKLLHEPGWWTGEPLDHFLLMPEFGQTWLGQRIAGVSWITAPMGWWTLGFEVLFPFLIWFRRTNPILLALGVGFHAGLFSLMNVGSFSFVAVAGYPVLLHPEVARALWSRLRSLRSWQDTAEL